MGTRGQVRVVESRGKAHKGLTFGGEYDTQHVLRGMMWSDNYWLFCDKSVRLVSMVNDVIEELLDLDMEPKLESLWWTSTHEAEEKETLKMVNRGLAWDLSFIGWQRVSGCRSNVCAKGMGSWWRDGYICRSERVPMKTKCRRVLSHVYSTAQNGSVNWPWSVAMLAEVRAWEA